MSIKIMAQIWETGPDDKTELLVMLALADFCNDAGECYPSMERIAAKSRLSDERSARRIVRRLQDAGWLEIDTQGGRNGCNRYHLKLGLKVPRTQSPPDPEAHDPGPSLPKPRTGEPPEPSRTVKEPSGGTDAQKVQKILSEFASPEAAVSFITYRRKQKGKALSPTAAKRLARHLMEIRDGGGDPSDALGLAEERGWLSIESEWYLKRQPPEAKKSNAISAQETRIEVWRGATRLYVNQGIWHLADRSPPPDHHGTLVPAEILREFNITPTIRKIA